MFASYAVLAAAFEAFSVTGRLPVQSMGNTGFAHLAPSLSTQNQKEV